MPKWGFCGIVYSMAIVKKSHIKNTAKIALGGGIGFSLFWLTSHPTKSPFRRKLPDKRIKNIGVLPEIKIYRKDKSYHLHHWMSLSTLYLFLMLTKKRKILRSKMVNGFLLGSILQGLSYKDRFKVIKKAEEELEQVVELPVIKVKTGVNEN